jgi:hypothetical protein
MSLFELWKSHPTRRAELAELINTNPALSHAIAILKEQVYKTKIPPTGGGAYSLMEYYALQGATQTGYMACLETLLDLAKLSPHKAPDRQPWATPPETVRDAPTSPPPSTNS